MKRYLLAATLVCAPVQAAADPSIPDIIDDHILPRFEALATTTDTLSHVAQETCLPASEDLRRAYGIAFDAWISASHLRFGPTEVDDRAFALAFWPDSRGATPQALAKLIADQDPIAFDPDSYADVSIAARGFYALEFLIYDDALLQQGDAQYHCTLVQTVAADIAATAAAIHRDWVEEHADVLLTPGAEALYRNDEEVLRELLKALTAGLQFTQDSRLGRPLGTFERPRPTRAEARRSGRSARHVTLSLEALHDLAGHLAAGDAALTATLDQQFADALARLAELDVPVFAGVSDPQTRFRIEVLSQAVGTIRTTVLTGLGQALGVSAGFNALDGD
ncbi:imelysin family protein [Flavimaricola marinus]|uniref:Iron-regulated protein A n=1 Tax=Flavimaricola marinus TaxID=1819565 RepID=A0A238LBJ4_9RHOB|nr:imelysin family protein [Flavimaricola marinus]SMY06336.1 Iron-regulated protein A precursor [Flavimaricola marinus]